MLPAHVISHGLNSRTHCFRQGTSLPQTASQVGSSYHPEQCECDERRGSFMVDDRDRADTVVVSSAFIQSQWLCSLNTWPLILHT